MKLKVISVSFDTDVKYKEFEPRKFHTTHELNITIVTNVGVKRVRLDAGWKWDGRSGGDWLDCLAPNLGTQDEIKTYLLHDLGFSTLLGLSFSECNDLLYTMLRSKCKYSYLRATAVYSGVSLLGSKFYGEYTLMDWDYMNIYKTHVTHSDR